MFTLLSTCPESRDFTATAESYIKRIEQVLRWSERHNFQAMLIYTDNGLLDPWLIAQHVLQQAPRVTPLIAIQPAYMHPYWVAKKITTLAYMYQNSVWLNLVAGGFPGDLAALGEDAEHDTRYERLREYATIVLALLKDDCPVSLNGVHYQVKNLRLQPSLPRELMPRVVMAGSSPASLNLADELGAIRITHANISELTNHSGDPSSSPAQGGYRFGIIARENSQEAWHIAHARFPADRAGEIGHQLASRLTDSQWHQELSTNTANETANPFWLGPFSRQQAFCPYYVGSIDEVAAAIEPAVIAGARTFILDIPQEEADLEMAARVFQLLESSA